MKTKFYNILLFFITLYITSCSTPNEAAITPIGTATITGVPSEITVAVGDTESYSIGGASSGGLTAIINDEAVALVFVDEANFLIIDAISLGSTTITIIRAATASFSQTRFLVRLSVKRTQSVSLAQNEFLLAAGDATTIDIIEAGEGNLDVSSNFSEIATARVSPDSKLLITGIAKGDATITLIKRENDDFAPADFSISVKVKEQQSILGLPESIGIKNGATKNFIISGKGDGTLDVTSKDSNIVTAEIIGNRLIISSQNNGKVEVTVTKEESNSYFESTFTINVDVTNFDGGVGTAADPYQISTIQQLNSIRSIQNSDSFLSSHYILLNHIDATTTKTFDNNKGFQPIGIDTTNRNTGTPFSGSFDGRGFIISNLHIDRVDEDYVALFGRTHRAVIKRLYLENVKITGRDFVGGLVGRSELSSITDSYVNGNIKAIGVERINAGNTSFSGSTGGLVGANESSTITNSYSAGFVIGRSLIVAGGLVGRNNTSEIRHSYSSSFVIGGSVYVGGLVGINDTSSTIVRSYAVGSVSGNAGGLVGQNTRNSIINYSYSLGLVLNNNDVGGGLVKLNNDNANVQNSYWNTETSGQATSDGGIGVTSNNMLDSDGSHGETAFAGWGNREHWNNQERYYPILRNHIAHDDLQSVHIATGLFRLANSNNGNILGGKIDQRDLTVDSNNGFNGNTLAVLDTNAAADNSTIRDDFANCEIANPINTVDTINNTKITLVTKTSTSNPNGWVGDVECNIEKTSSYTPIAGDKLNLQADITKGIFSYTKEFSITFQ